MAGAQRRTIARCEPVEQWHRFETAWHAAGSVADPTHDVELTVTFTGPDGARATVRGFWDGADVWRVRWSPDAVGRWTYRTTATPPDPGLDAQRGEFDCVAATGEHRFARHGAVDVSADGHYLAHADGTPFLCLGDTVWNGALESTAPDWEYYLRDRTEKNFTAALIAVDQFQGARATAEGERPFTGRQRIAINPAFFQRIDPRLDALNDRGLLGILLFLHAGATTTYNSGNLLAEDQAVVLGRYIVARYGAHQVMWDFLAEAPTEHARVESWKRAGRAIFDHNPGRPVTLHPPGAGHWALHDFAGEKWMTVLGYQSSHGDTDLFWRFILQGPPSTDWQRRPHRPIMNLEPPYEDHRSFTSGRRFDTRTVRLGLWASLLATAVSGVTYGGNGVWGWNDGRHMAWRHRNVGRPKAWWDALHLPGSTAMRHLAECLRELEWWTLRPTPEAVAVQPGETDLRRTVVVASAPDHRLMLAYLPAADTLQLHATHLPPAARAHWFNPRTGMRTPAELTRADGVVSATPPDGEDWVFVGRAGH